MIDFNKENNSSILSVTGWKKIPAVFVFFENKLLQHDRTIVKCFLNFYIVLPPPRSRLEQRTNILKNNSIGFFLWKKIIIVLMHLIF